MKKQTKKYKNARLMSYSVAGEKLTQQMGQSALKK